MKLTIRRLLPGEIKTEIIRKINDSNEIRIAVAWAQSGHDVELALRANVRKIKKIVVGMDFNGTDPAFLGFYGKHHLALGRATGTFHPKIYYFEKGKWAACIEGSSNFTKSAFERNAESGTLITGDKNDPFFKKTRFLIDEYARNGANLKPRELRNYRTIASALKKQQEKAKKEQKKLRRKKEKAKRKRYQQEAKRIKKRKIKEKRRKKEQKRCAEKSMFFGWSIKKKRRKSRFRFKLLLLLLILGAVFFYHPHFSHSRTHPPHHKAAYHLSSRQIGPPYFLH